MSPWDFLKATENVVSLSADNCNVQKCIADMLEKPLVGCATHRFNLVQDIISEHDQLIQIVNALMVKLSNKAKARSKLRSLTYLGPLRNNSTSWNSTYLILKMLCDLKEYLLKLQLDYIDDLTQSASDCCKISSLCMTLTDLESVTKSLQEDSISLSDVKHLFEDVVGDYPSTANRLGPEADILHDSNFESAVAKIQDNLVSALNSDEKSAVEQLRCPESTALADSESDSGLPLAERSSKRRRLSKSLGDVQYIDLSLIFPTSNICERLFSVAGFALTDRRQSISPVRFQQQIFLCINSNLWDVSDIH